MAEVHGNRTHPRRGFNAPRNGFEDRGHHQVCKHFRTGRPESGGSLKDNNNRLAGNPRADGFGRLLGLEGPSL